MMMVRFLFHVSLVVVAAAFAGLGASAQVQIDQLPPRGSQSHQALPTPPGTAYVQQLPQAAVPRVEIEQVPPGAAAATARRQAERRAEAERRRVAEPADDRPVFDLPVRVARLTPRADPAADEEDTPIAPIVGDDNDDSDIISPLEGFNVMQLPSVGRGTELTLSE
jgi:hypothetical protein